MIHLVTEDSDSGRKFWEKYCNYMESILQVSIQVTSSYGSPNLLDTIKNICRPGDYLLVAIDNTSCIFRENGEVLDTSQTILRHKMSIGAFCVRNSIKVKFSKLYCFESILLSYTEICTLLALESDVLNRLLCELCGNLWHYADIFNMSPYAWCVSHQASWLCDRCSLNKGNWEVFLAEFLSICTRASKGLFRISKSAFQSCWWESCDTILQNPRYSAYLSRGVKECIWDGLSSHEKMKELAENSLLCEDELGIASLMKFLPKKQHSEEYTTNLFSGI